MECECGGTFLTDNGQEAFCEECGIEQNYDAPSYPDGDERCIPYRLGPVNKLLDNRWN